MGIAPDQAIARALSAHGIVNDDAARAVARHLTNEGLLAPEVPDGTVHIQGALTRVLDAAQIRQVLQEAGVDVATIDVVAGGEWRQAYTRHQLPAFTRVVPDTQCGRATGSTRVGAIQTGGDAPEDIAGYSDSPPA